MIQEALDTIMYMDEEDTQRYLLVLLERDPELFYSIHNEVLQLDFLNDMREEEHNGYPMYPELSR